MEKITKLAAGTIQVRCSVAEKKIMGMEINGDFFAGKGLEQLCRALVGCEYKKDRVYQLLKEQYSDNLIYGVSREELLEAIF